MAGCGIQYHLIAGTAHRIPAKGGIVAKRPQINIRISDEKKAALEKWAVDEGRPLSNLVRRIIDEALKAKQSVS